MQERRDSSQPAPAEAVRPRTALELFSSRVAQSGPRAALRHKQGGAWISHTFADWDRASREIAAGLRSFGVARGDRVCLLSASRPEWFLADLGILRAGAVTVPLYQSNTADQCEYIIHD